MRCHEVRSLIGPYLDSELDAKTSFDIQQHLESCAECARVVEAERTLDARIFAVLRDGHRSAPLWERLEADIDAPGFWNRFKRAKPMTFVSFGAAVAALVALAGFLWLRAPRLELAASVAKDHEEYLAGKMAPEFAGAVPESVAQKLGARLNTNAFAVLPAASEFRYEGARLCHLSGVPAAWTLGRFEGVPVSLIVFRKSELERFPGTKARLEAGHPVLCARTGRFQFAARVLDGHVVCAVAQTSKEKLEALVKSVRGAG